MMSGPNDENGGPDINKEMDLSDKKDTSKKKEPSSLARMFGGTIDPLDRTARIEKQKAEEKKTRDELTKKLGDGLAIKKIGGDPNLTTKDGKSRFAVIIGTVLVSYSSIDGIPDIPIDKVDRIELHQAEGETRAHITLTDGGEYDFKPLPQQPTQIEEEESPYVRGQTARNHEIAIERTIPNIDSRVYYEILSESVMIDKSIFGEEIGYERYTNEEHNNRILKILESEVIPKNGFTTNRDTIDYEIYERARKHPRNLFMEEILKTRWDGTPRIDRFLWRLGCRGRGGILEADEEIYIEFVSKGIFLAPLEKMDLSSNRMIQFSVVLIGKTQWGKSTLIQKLSLKTVNNDWYKEYIKKEPNIIQFYEDTKGAVLVEWAENTALKTSDNMNVFKSLVDTTHTQTRFAFRKDARTFSIRSCQFITTNYDKAIPDDGTGLRRMFPLFVGEDNREIKPYDLDEREVRQLWAEAVHRYSEGERWDDGYEVKGEDPYDVQGSQIRSLRKTCAIIREAATMSDDITDVIKEYLSENCSEKGEFVSDEDIRECLRAHEYSSVDIRRAMTTVKNSPSRYGPYKRKDTTRVSGKDYSGKTQRTHIRGIQHE